MKWKLLVIVLVIIIIVIGVLLINLNKKETHRPVGISIQPSSTPEVNIRHWVMFADLGSRISFRYPDNLRTKFIRAQSWPPLVTIKNKFLWCEDMNKSQVGSLYKFKTIGGTVFCIESETGGAAGTIYTDYTYSFTKKDVDEVINIQFTLAYPQCDNYADGVEKEECKKEEQFFDMDKIVYGIAQSINVATKISSPITIAGSVPSGWMFEGVFPVKLLDSKGNIITTGQAKEVVPGSWSSGKEVEFRTVLNFLIKDKSGYMVLEKDNPSGLPQNAGTYEIPVMF